MKTQFGSAIFRYVGNRAERHIIRRLERAFDNGWKVDSSKWKEIDLYDFVKEAAKGNAFVTHVEKSNIAIIDPSEKSYIQATIKSLINQPYKLKDFEHNAVVHTILDFYIHNEEAAEPNDLFLKVEGKDRAYGFHLLNVHTADIDIKMSKNERNNHLMIRYNENASGGWETRIEYISQIFQGMGFRTEHRNGYLHMNHPKPGDKAKMTPLVQEAIRGLVSTTHLNLTFDYASETLDEAVTAFQSGKTDIYDYLEEMPLVIEKKEQRELERMIYFQSLKGDNYALPNEE